MYVSAMCVILSHIIIKIKYQLFISDYQNVSHSQMRPYNIIIVSTTAIRDSQAAAHPTWNHLKTGNE